MEYFKILNLIKEPFSNSPEPELFYQSPQHVDCLQKLELGVRLRRGLNVVIGDVGTGKTTLCRQLIQRFSRDENIETHLLLDPHFSKASEFLCTLSEIFTGSEGDMDDVTEWGLRERIKNHLFDKGVGKGKGIVLIIDEGQKIPAFGIEILRELLNYETNDYKLLQIVIFAQKEFWETLEKHPGFEDRINVTYDLGPLNFRDTRSMIQYRLEKSSESGKSSIKITYPALRAIFRFTGGYPRKIVTLCHQIILALIIQNKKTAGWFLVKGIASGNSSREQRRVSWAHVTILLGVIVIFLLLVVTPERLEVLNSAVSKYEEAEKAKESGELENTPRVTTATSAKSEVQRGKSKKNESVIAASLASHEPERDKGETVEEEAQIPPKSATPEPAPEVTAPVAAEAPVVVRHVSAYPDILGQLTVEKQGVVWFMIRDIYGACDKRHLRLVKKVNPHIGNLSRVFEGDIINFPSIPAETSSFDRGFYLVEIAEKENLREAYAFLKESRGQNLPPIHLIPLWNSYGGLRFSLIINKSFGNRESAEEALERLPMTVSSGARIIEQWEEGTVLFSSDPS